MNQLDEKGWVFVADGNAYRCCMWGERPWLFKWQDRSHLWVSVRLLTQADVWTLPHNLTQEQQDLYNVANADAILRAEFPSQFICKDCGGSIGSNDYEADELRCQKCTNKHIDDAMNARDDHI